MVPLCRASRVGGQDAVPRLLLHPSTSHACRVCGVHFRVGFVRAPRRKNPYHRLRRAGTCVLLCSRRPTRRAWPSCSCRARRLSPARLEPLPPLLHRDSEDIRACVAFCGNRLLPPDIRPPAGLSRGRLRVRVRTLACVRVRHAHQSRRDSRGSWPWTSFVGSHLGQGLPLVRVRRRVWPRGRLRHLPLRPHCARRPLCRAGLSRRSRRF